MKIRLLTSLLSLTLAACDPGHGATDDDVAADVAVADDVEVAAADTEPPPDVWPDGFWVPTSMDQLYGLWVNDDGESIRAFRIQLMDPYDPDMSGVSPVYELYRYPVGGPITLAERGRATLAMGPLLRLDTVWSETVTDKGKKTELTFLPAPAKSFALATGAGTPRVYVRSGTLP